MIVYVLLIAAISVYEIKIMARDGLKKELGLFIFFAVIALGLAWVYTSNPYGIRIADSVLSILGIKH